MHSFVKLAILAATGVAFTTPAAAVTVVNPGFETGDFTGWTVVANQGTAVISGGANVFAGDFAARLRSNPTTTKSIGQLVTTVAGTHYQLAYWLRNTGNVTDTFSAISGPVTTVWTDRAPFGYTLFTQDFIAAGASTVIGFTYNHDNPGGFFLDEVSVTVVPEPATWALLIAGFTMVGAAMRRRTVAVAA